MYNRNDNSSRNGASIGFTGLLTIAFIVLKLCHVIDWSWVWVLSPIWISLSITIIIMVVVIAVEIIKDEVKEKRRQRRMQNGKN